MTYSRPRRTTMGPGCLTAVFGMGTGGAIQVWSPGKSRGAAAGVLTPTTAPLCSWCEAKSCSRPVLYHLERQQDHDRVRGRRSRVPPGRASRVHPLLVPLAAGGDQCGEAVGC